MADPPRGSFQLSGKSPIRCRGTRGCTLALVCTRRVLSTWPRGTTRSRSGKGSPEALRNAFVPLFPHPASFFRLLTPLEFRFTRRVHSFFFLPPLSFMLRVLFKQPGDTVGVSVFFCSRYSGKNNISAISGTRALMHQRGCFSQLFRGWVGQTQQ